MPAIESPRAKGYRLQPPEITKAAAVLAFEHDVLGNHTDTRLGLEKFLGLEGLPWKDLLEEFRQRYPESYGIWVTPTREAAILNYGRSGGTLFEIEYDPEKTVIYLGEDGIFVLDPIREKEVAYIDPTEDWD